MGDAELESGLCQSADHESARMALYPRALLRPLEAAVSPMRYSSPKVVRGSPLVPEDSTASHRPGSQTCNTKTPLNAQYVQPASLKSIESGSLIIPLATSDQRVSRMLAQPGLPPFYTLTEQQFGEMFAGKSGQRLLLAYEGTHGTEALNINILRPSKVWRTDERMRLYKESIAQDEQKNDWDSITARSSTGTEWKKSKFNPISNLQIMTNFEIDEIGIWPRIREEYLNHRPSWHRYVPFWGPIQLEERNMEVLCAHENSPWSVTVDKGKDRNTIVRETQQMASLLSQVEIETGKCCDWTKDELDFLYHGRYECDLSDEECLTKRCEQAKERQKRLKHLDLFIELFNHPHRAAGKRMVLCGVAQETCIYDYSELSWEKFQWKEYSAGAQRLNTVRGLYLIVGWKVHECYFGGTLALTVAVTVLWKLISGDWSVAAGFGCLCVALVTYGFMVKQQQQQQ
ncbi:Hypothetical protein R9X50_00360400 [Acrodontium crateriforme]|uniref:Transmembrane protein n=1 Tax=Acrodontium crateriforme TaxID=150365 RepID=A0AAQ3M3R2_9PEZI|nr:Hypothetical protein R9X50_00360400 [Acrodontium crateriforme]